MRRFLLALLAVLVLAPLLLLALTVQRAPLVGDAAAPRARAVEQTRDVIDRVRGVVASAGAVASVSVSQDELNGVLAAAQRVAPGLRGRARVGRDGVWLALSVGTPLLPAGAWLNLSGEVAPSPQGLRVVSARVGHLPVPPSLVLLAARLGLDHVLGDGLGSEALATVGRIDVAPPLVSLTMAGDPASRAAFFDRLKERSVGDTSGSVRAAVREQMRFLRKAYRRHQLPERGSLVAFLKAATAHAAADGGGEDDMRAAIYLLALACGDPAFGEVVDLEVDPEMLAQVGCGHATLAGRDDLKRHFVVSAGLYAATTSRNVAFGVGELKELLDSAESEGFSFNDIAADAAGVRFARALLTLPPEAWPGFLAGLRDESDLMPSLDGLADGLDEAAFEARFGGVDSPEYAAAVAEVRRRVAALPLYAVPATN